MKQNNHVQMMFKHKRTHFKPLKKLRRNLFYLFFNFFLFFVFFLFKENYLNFKNKNKS
jgi:hypothetical protein